MAQEQRYIVAQRVGDDGVNPCSNNGGNPPALNLKLQTQKI